MIKQLFPLGSDLLALASSRRVVGALALLIAFGLRWRLVGQPEEAATIAFLAALGAWWKSNTDRPHVNGSLANSRRMFVGMFAQVLPAVLVLICEAGWFCITLPAGILDAGVQYLAGLFFWSEGIRRHEVSAEDAPPADGG